MARIQEAVNRKSAKCFWQQNLQPALGTPEVMLICRERLSPVSVGLLCLQASVWQRALYVWRPQPCGMPCQVPGGVITCACKGLTKHYFHDMKSAEQLSCPERALSLAVCQVVVSSQQSFVSTDAACPWEVSTLKRSCCSILTVPLCAFYHVLLYVKA